MSCSRITFLLILFTLLFLYITKINHPLKKWVLIVLSLWFLARYVNLFVWQWRPAPSEFCVSIEEAQTRIKSGDLVQVFSSEDTTRLIKAVNLVRFIEGFNCVHTALVITYNGQPYVQNTYENSYFHDRMKTYSDSSRIKVLGSRKGWTFYLEPIDCFLEAEKHRKSNVTVHRCDKEMHFCEKSTTLMMDKAETIGHCCSHLGVLLAALGRIPPKTNWYPNWMHYMPKQIMDEMKPVETINFRVI